MSTALKQDIHNEARRLGFILTGVTTPDPPPHLSIFDDWLMQGRHASMDYLADDRARARRADLRLILPECKSILVLALPYQAPKLAPSEVEGTAEVFTESSPNGCVASYAWGNDYHLIIPEKLKTLVAFIEQQVGHSILNRWYTDTGPILERELAQRAGLGWIGRNTLLISPKLGSYFLLAEIFLDLDLEPDFPFTTDHCGTCTRCIEACPTQCILPNRTIDARRCISYLTIELKEDIPLELRPMLGNWVFGCDVCQMVCPWNRFAPSESASESKSHSDMPHPNLIRELELMPKDFNYKFKNSPVKRARRRGYLRNVAVALGNSNDTNALPALDQALNDSEPMVREHATWAIRKIKEKNIRMKKLLIATNNKGKVEEIQDLLKSLDIELVTPVDIGLKLDIVEDGKTYAENAGKKAVAFAHASGLISLADDSGLEVDALDGAPGLFSARYLSKPKATDADRRAYLLQNLQNKPRPWTAHFHATIAIAVPDKPVQFADGQCSGEIIPEERGTGGFGYDPIFFFPQLGQTMAELNMEEKNRLSHRARAIINARPIIQKIFA